MFVPVKVAWAKGEISISALGGEADFFAFVGGGQQKRQLQMRL